MLLKTTGRGAAAAAAALCAVIACKTPAPKSTVKEGEAPAVPGETAASTVHPPGYLGAAENAALWGEYCAGGADVGQEVQPNYANADVKKAATILSIVKRTSFKTYGDILKLHKTALPPAATGITPEAHDFLTYLCGEFRDRATMVRAKINWVFALRYLDNGDSQKDRSCEARNDPMRPAGDAPAVTAFDPKKSPWAQMCIEDYTRYLAISRGVFDWREKAINSPVGLELEDGTVVKGKLKIGDTANIDRFVPGYTICETKYIFADYVKKQKTFSQSADSYKAYADGLKAFTASTCSEEDKGWYYDFRGDSNYKPNSPESNGMIWTAKVFAAQCKDRTTAVPGAAITSADCRKYYEAPFRSRYEGARAGFGAWMMHSMGTEADFGNASGSYFTIAQHNHADPADVFSANGPYLFRQNDEFEDKKITQVGSAGAYLPGFDSHWHDSDFGLTARSGLTGDKLAEFLVNRIQRAVDRHTNWYKSGYDSAPSLPNSNKLRRMMDQAYSPFVASSYEMSESNNFSQCGVTIPCGNSPEEFTAHKQWMFIFKVKKENWLRPEDIAAGTTKLDFDRMWFDETAFGNDGLANRERAWDRLGSPMEDEHAEILYLWRIPAE